MASITLLLCSVSFSHCQFHDWETVNFIGQHWPQLGWPNATMKDCPRIGFPGLTCSADGTRVQQLILLNGRLTGTIPPELGNLTGLDILVMFNNRLTGSIPSQVGNLARLQVLALFNNLLTGPIPPELGKLTRLQVLTIFNNRLNGTIPPELGNLTSLRALALFNNLLTGPIPPELGNLTGITMLALFNNLLTGPIPPELGNLTGCRILALNDNQLSGLIPAQFSKLTSLEYLSLQCNPDLDICSTNVTTKMFWPGTCSLDLPVTQTGCRTNWAANGCDVDSYKCSAAPLAIPMNPINSASSLIVSLGLVVATALAVVVF